MQILGTFTTSVHKALAEIDPAYQTYPGFVVAGSHSPESFDVDDILEDIHVVRKHNIPFLGICFGHQLAAIEYARNVLGIKDATSEEFGKGTFVVKRRNKLKVGMHDGESYWSYFDVDLPNWEKPSHMISVPYHPEYQSRKSKPHPLLVDFLTLCKTKI